MKSSISLGIFAALGCALLPATVTAANGDLTIYFTRHAEKQTITEKLNKSDNIWSTDPYGNWYIAGSGNTNAKAYTRDDVCGQSKCAEELSDKGELRAMLLADWFSKNRITDTLDAVYATHKIRTQQTVTPTATAAGLAVEQRPQEIWDEDTESYISATELNPEKTGPSICSTLDAIEESRLAGHDTILIAGHSGTLYKIMGAGDGDNCAGLGLKVFAPENAERFPVDDENKVRYYGDIWKIVIRANGQSKFIYRRNLQPMLLQTANESK